MKKLRIVLFILVVLAVPFLFAPQPRVQASTPTHIYTEKWFESSFQMNVTTEDMWTVGGLYPVFVAFNVTSIAEPRSLWLDRIEIGLMATDIKKNQSINRQLSHIGETYIVMLLLNASDPLFRWIKPAETGSYVFFVDVKGAITDMWTGQTWNGSAFETFFVKIYSPPAPITIVKNLTPDIRVGDNFKLQISVKNDGDYPITSLQVNLWELYGATIIGEKNKTTPVLEPKRSVPLTFELKANKVGSHLITFEISYLSYGGYRVWRVDNASLTINKMFSYITCSIFPETTTQGENVTVLGTISPAHEALVTLTFKRPDGRAITRVTRSAIDGSFNYRFTPDAGGSWTVDASWPGDLDTGGATSPTIPFLCKEFSYVTCSIFPETITQSENVTVLGTISPAHEALVTLTFKRPDGRAITRVTRSAIDGSFNYRFTPDVGGSWTVDASWPGDPDTGGATSPTMPFTVRPQERVLAYETIGLYIVVIVMVAIVSYRLVFRRKRSTRRL